MSTKVPRSTVEELLRRAGDLPSSERLEFLYRHADGDPDLLETLSQAIEDDDSFLVTGGALQGGVFDSLVDEWSGTKPGETIGPYRLIEKMGSGGMGDVWRASQLEPVKREVALKLIRAGMDSEEVLTRFHAERQALARMDHSHIARVYDAGITESGRPYFVMELIEGLPITTFCDRNRLSTPQRIELFLDLCAGVDHAHKRGIIHRDLKPSNLLVAREGGKPVPKIIDFGIAKAIEGADETPGASTRLGQWIGTPEYMSPEQASLSSFEIDTRTDVYSLGAVLYELLSGSKLHDSKRLRDSGPDEMRRRIREEEPSRPSERISQLGDSTTEVAESRGTEPTSLARSIKGDLDWIVMKALEKDRERRYDSAHELAEDLQRHLRHEPVLAGPPTLPYRLSKFVRRHRVAVTAAGLMAIALLVGATLATVGLVRARKAESLARTEAAKANEINRFLRRILSSARPEGGLGRDVTVVEALAEARSSIDGSFADSPEVGSDIRSVIGATYLELGLFDEARELLEESLEIRRDLHGDVSSEVAGTLNELARLNHMAGNLTEAEEQFHEVLETNRALYGPEHPRVAATLNNLGMLLVHEGRREEALEMLSEALELKREIFGEVHAEVTPTLNNLGLLLADMRRYDEAEQYLLRALEGNRELHGPEHGLVAINLNNLATNYSDRGDFERAEETFREALELKEIAFGTDHTSYGITLSNYAQAMDRQGKFEQALPMHERALAIYRETLEETSHRIGIAKTRYGLHLLRTDRYPEAEDQLRQALSNLEAAFGSDDPRTREARQLLIELYDKTERPDEARELRATG